MTNQKRRQDRINDLIGKQKAIQQRQAFFLPAQRDELSIDPVRTAYDEKMNDPEYVWKQHGNSGWSNKPLGGTQSSSQYASETSPSILLKIRNSLIICFFLYVLIWGMFQIHYPLAVRGQNLVINSLNDEFQYEAIAAWYNKTFQGAPSFLPTFDINKAEKVNSRTTHSFIPPLNGGIVSTSFVSSNQGITLMADVGSPVVSADAGWVVFAGNSSLTGSTIVIQHANQIQTIYGWVNDSPVKKNDWIKAGEQIGTVSQSPLGEEEGLLYFAVKQKNSYINPMEVISLD